jgi:hypothetical protein
LGHANFYDPANHEAASKFVGQKSFAAKNSADAAGRGPAYRPTTSWTSFGRSGSMAAERCICEMSMKKLVFAILLISSPALAQTKLLPKGVTARVDNCAPIGRTEDGKLVYSMKCENLPAPPPLPPQAQVREAPAPAPEPEVQRSGIFGWSYERKRPDE